jgi:hypothetical protein
MAGASMSVSPRAAGRMIRILIVPFILYDDFRANRSY